MVTEFWGIHRECPTPFVAFRDCRVFFQGTPPTPQFTQAGLGGFSQAGQKQTPRGQWGDRSGILLWARSRKAGQKLGYAMARLGQGERAGLHFLHPRPVPPLSASPTHPGGAVSLSSASRDPRAWPFPPRGLQTTSLRSLPLCSPSARLRLPQPVSLMLTAHTSAHAAARPGRVGNGPPGAGAGRPPAPAPPADRPGRKHAP